MATIPDALANTAVIRAVILSGGGTDRDVLAAVMTVLVESGGRNLEYGDKDSLGLYQQRPMWWGPAAQRLDPVGATQSFLAALKRIKDRDQRALGDVCQLVQGSAYPDRYAARQADAQALLDQLPPMRVPAADPRLSAMDLHSAMGAPNADTYWAQVVVLQRALVAAGFAAHVNGYYDVGTVAAVKACQAAAGSSVADGWLGPLELEWLRRKVAPSVVFTPAP